MIRDLASKWAHETDPLKYWIYLFFYYLYRQRIWGPIIYFAALWQSYLISFKLFGPTLIPRVAFSSGLFRVHIDKSINSKVYAPIGISIIFEKWKSKADTTICLRKESIIQFERTLVIGEGCMIKVGPSGRLFFGGGKGTDASGITCDSIILCSRSISIGTGTIISWGTYISDSSQHKFNGALRVDDLKIGNYVWISEGVTCGPGCKIGDGSVVGAKSFVNKEFPANTFLAGTPAKIIKEKITWER